MAEAVTASIQQRLIAWDTLSRDFQWDLRVTGQAETVTKSGRIRFLFLDRGSHFSVLYFLRFLFSRQKIGHR